MKQWLNKIWNYLKGKKRNIGTMLYLAGIGLEAFFPELLPAKQTIFIQAAGAAIAGVGVVDALARSKSGTNLISKIKLKGR